MSIQSIFDKITGRHVRFVGLLFAIVAGALVSAHMGTHAGIGYLTSVAVAAMNWNFPVLGKFEAFNNFADAKFWPTFVLLGVATLFVAPNLFAKLAIGAVMMIFDGMYFPQNY